MQNNLEALFFFSQCDHTYAVEDETLHLLSHTIRHSSNTMHESLEGRCEEKMGPQHRLGDVVQKRYFSG